MRQKDCSRLYRVINGVRKTWFILVDTVPNMKIQKNVLCEVKK